MMRALACLALIALAPACGARGPEHCELTVTRQIAFTAPDAADVLTVRSFGRTCAQAIGLLTITTAEGDPAYAHAAQLRRAFGEGFAEPELEAMRAFLERWSAVEIASAADAPAWTELAPGQTTLDRLTYDDVRARDLPKLCHFSGTGRQTCVFWEPGAGGAGHLLDREIAPEDQTQ